MTHSKARARGRTAAGTGAAAVFLLVAGVILLAFYGIAHGTAHHAYDSGVSAPHDYRLTAGRTYQISTHGGPSALTRNGLKVNSSSCTWSANGSASQYLAVTPLGSDSRATHVVATFVAPASGLVRVQCPKWGAVFIDDADNASPDLAGYFLLAAVFALTGGVATGLAALYRRSGAARTAGAARAAQDASR